MDPQLLQMLGMLGQQAPGFGYGMGSGGGSNYGQLGSTIGGLAGMGFGPAGGMIGSTLGGLAGGIIGGKKDKKKQKKLRQRIEQQRAATQSIFGKGLGQQEAFARQATQQRLGGFDLAKKAAAQAAEGSKRQALQRESQLGAQLSQGLANRGLGGTSVGANLQRGLAGQTNQQFADIDEALGQYFGNLAMGRAGVEAGGTEALADLASQRSNFDIQNANFWSPYNWQRLGAVDTRMAGGGGMGGGGMGGFDPSMLAQLFGQGA